MEKERLIRIPGAILIGELFQFFSKPWKLFIGELFQLFPNLRKIMEKTLPDINEPSLWDFNF